MEVANQIWDTSNIFAETAYYYAKYRPGYPKEVLEKLVTNLDLNKSSNVLDLGCGTGQIAIEIASYVNKVYAVDPQEDMLTEGKKIASEKEIANIEWINSESSKIKSVFNEQDKIDATVIGRAFHWMNREETLEDLYNVMSQNGSIAILGDSNFTKAKADWWNKVDEILEMVIGKRKAGTKGMYRHPEKLHEQVLNESKFGRCYKDTVKSKRKWTIEKVIGYLYSTSYCSLPIVGSKKNELEGLLREQLANYELEEDIEYDMFIVRNYH